MCCVHIQDLSILVSKSLQATGAFHIYENMLSVLQTSHWDSTEEGYTPRNNGDGTEDFYDQQVRLVQKFSKCRQYSFCHAA